MPSKNDSHQFKPLLLEIEDEPSNPLGRIIFWIIIAALVFAVAWMCLGKVDVVVSARGKVVPVGEVKILQPLSAGVLSKIQVKPGDYVRSGQVLIEIDPSTTEPELESMQTTANQHEVELLRLKALIDGKTTLPCPDKFDHQLCQAQQEIFASERDKIIKQITVKEEELQKITEQEQSLRKDKEQSEYLLEISRQRLQRMEPVRDIISRDEYDKAASEVRKNESDILISGYRLNELESTRNHIHKEIDFAREDEKNRLLKELSETNTRHIQLLGSIEKSSYVNARQQIVSPVNGHVNQLFINTVGGVVTPAEKLLSVVPADTPLEIQAKVANKDIGFIAKGMDASIKIDTFDFQKYGLLKGTVKQIAKDSIDDEKLGPVYEVYIRPKELTVRIDGIDTAVTTGMSLTAEVNVGKRRIIEFFIYPLIKYLDEGISVR
jgi:hemolysin D